MDLRNNQITIGEIVANPAAKALLEREFPQFANRAMLMMARNMTLSSVLRLAGGRFRRSR